MDSKEIVLSGTFQNMEHAIIESMHLLSPYSKYGDESVRCKDIYRLVQDAAIYVDGQLQTGNHRFTIFSSALFGRRSSLKLFQKMTDNERRGAWWKLKVPYDEALRIAMTLRLRNTGKNGEMFEWQSTIDSMSATREEDIRNKFFSFVTLSMLTEEEQKNNEEMEKKLQELDSTLFSIKNSASADQKTLLEKLIDLQHRIYVTINQKTVQPFDAIPDSSSISFFT